MRELMFLAKNDLARNLYINIANEAVNDIDFTNFNMDVNEIMKLYIILKYIEDGVDIWDSSLEDKIKKSLGIFSGKLNDENLVNIESSLNRNYLKEFWEYFEKWKIYKKISENSIKMLITNSENYIHNLLLYKGIVKQYDLLLKHFFLTNHKTAEFLINKYELSNDTLNIPNSLTLEDKNKILIDYINSDNPHINYLNYIYYSKNISVFNVSDKIKLIASKRKKIEKEKLFTNFNIEKKTKSGMMFQLSIKKQNEGVLHNRTGKKINISYSYEWLKNNTEPSTILNNFIYLFKFSDDNFRISLVNNTNDMSLFENLFSNTSKYMYKVTDSYELKNNLALNQLSLYYEFLKKNKIYLEDVIEYFFKTYLKDEFSIENFIIQMPSQNLNYLEKLRHIFPEMDSILKQFGQIVDDNSIDHDLLQISSEHLLFKNCKSMIQNKYVYPLSKELTLVNRLFFSNQSMLTHMEDIDYEYETFYELIRNENLVKENFKNYCYPKLEWLLENNYIHLDEYNCLEITDIKKIYIFKELFEFDVINYWNFPFRDKLDELIDTGFLEVSNDLFTKSEQEYFNYHLNKSQFTNSLDLRNSYLHGTQNENHKYNYFLTIKLFILIIIKFNDEFCIKNSKSYLEANHL